MRRVVCGALVVACLVSGSLGSVRAQSDVPAFTFVQESSGQVWMVAQGKRYAVAMYPSSDADIAAIPDSGQWVVPNAAGTSIDAGPRPSWANAAPAPLASADAPAFDGLGHAVVTMARGGSLRVSAMALTDPARSSNQFNRADGRFVLVEWIAENLGADPFALNPVALRVQTDGGYVFDMTNHAGHREPQMSLATLGTGQKLRGFLAYDVPRDQRVTALIYQYVGTPQVVIARV